MAPKSPKPWVPAQENGQFWPILDQNDPKMTLTQAEQTPMASPGPGPSLELEPSSWLPASERPTAVLALHTVLA